MTATGRRQAMWSFRPLLVFWAVTIGLLAGVAIGLQFVGPVPPAREAEPTAANSPGPGHPGAAAPPRPPAAPAQVPPSSAHPAPPLARDAAAIPDPDPAMMEPDADFPERMLPRPAGGRSPSTLYAAGFDPAERHPRVALVIDGAGLDRAMTQRAMALPPAVDLAFSAYAPQAVAAGLAQAARRQGRECLLSVPMEPSGYPESNEGPRALLTGAEPARNRQNLLWALGGVAGCVGATGGSDGMSGERYAQSAQAYADLLDTFAQRGLVYLDPRPDAAPPLGSSPPPRVVDVVVDRPPAPGEPATAQAIDRALGELADDAARHGSAIGLAGPPRPVMLDRIAVWANGLAARGIVLAPLTAIPPPHAAAAPPG